MAALGPALPSSGAGPAPQEVPVPPRALPLPLPAEEATAPRGAPECREPGNRPWESQAAGVPPQPAPRDGRGHQTPSSPTGLLCAGGPVRAPPGWPAQWASCEKTPPRPVPPHTSPIVHLSPRCARTMGPLRCRTGVEMNSLTFFPSLKIAPAAPHHPPPLPEFLGHLNPGAPSGLARCGGHGETASGQKGGCFPPFNLFPRSPSSPQHPLPAP